MVQAPAPIEAPAPVVAPAPAPVTPQPAPLPPAPAPLLSPALVAAIQQQASGVDAFVARPPVPSALAASPREKKDDDDVKITDAQCVAIGGSAPSRLPLSVVRPATDWWWR